jgi:hypothetical protein
VLVVVDKLPELLVMYVSSGETIRVENRVMRDKNMAAQVKPVESRLMLLVHQKLLPHAVIEGTLAVLVVGTVGLKIVQSRLGPSRG